MDVIAQAVGYTFMTILAIFALAGLAGLSVSLAVKRFGLLVDFAAFLLQKGSR